MYFPGDPLFAQDPIFNSIPDERARQRLVSRFDLATTEPGMGTRLPGSMSCCADATRRRWKTRMTTDGTTGEKPLGITPSQTVGPFFGYALTPSAEDVVRAIFTNDLVTPDVAGERIRIEGFVRDGDGEAIPDAIVEIWQPDGEGRFAGAGRRNAAFAGFGRTGVDADGFYVFTTVKPGPVPGPEGRLQAPHIDVCILARGLLRHLVTRIYFEDEAANEGDAILALVPPDRRGTLVATRRERAGEIVYAFDIRLQGDAETVFFEA